MSGVFQYAEVRQVVMLWLVVFWRCPLKIAMDCKCTGTFGAQQAKASILCDTTVL